MTTSEVGIFSDDSYQLSCSLCPEGQILKADQIKYACISPHIHPDDHGQPKLTTVALDRICGCGHCCSCSTKEEREEKGILESEQMSGFISVLCAKHGRPSLRERVLYQYCFFCTGFKWYECRKCQELVRVDGPGYFYDYQNYRETCDCGEGMWLKDLPLSVDLLKNIWPSHLSWSL